MQKPTTTSPKTETPGYPGAVLEAFARFSDRVAFVHEERETTYGEALSCVHRLAYALEACGIDRGDGVGFLAAAGPEMLLTRLAAQLLGCRQILVEPAYSAVEQARILTDADITALVHATGPHSAHAAEVLHRLEPPLVLALGPDARGTDLLGLAEDFPDTPMTPRAEPDDIARLVYTGGSTGHAKGCCHTYAAMSRHWAWQPARWSAEIAAVAGAAGRFLVTKPNAGGAEDFMALALLSGGTVFLNASLDAGATLRTIERERITAVFLGTAKLGTLLTHQDIGTADLSSLRAVVFAGSAITTSRFRQAIDRFGPILHQAYGQSEAGLISLLTPADVLAGPEDRLRSAGRPQPGVEITVLDSEGTVLPAGETGEVCVRTPQRMTGYWRRPQLNATVLADGLLRTGDVGRLDADGFLHLLDRAKDMVIVRGENCSSSGIEDVLTRHPGIREAAVIGVPHETDGEAVHAVLVPEPHTPVTQDELRSLVETELSALHAPKSFAFTGRLPYTPAGKVDKKSLRAPFWAGEQRRIN
ncbi:AMP-binding protein [Streptomyces sp. NPDC055078]